MSIYRVTTFAGTAHASEVKVQASGPLAAASIAVRRYTLPKGSKLEVVGRQAGKVRTYESMGRTAKVA